MKLNVYLITYSRGVAELTLFVEGPFLAAFEAIQMFYGLETVNYHAKTLELDRKIGCHDPSPDVNTRLYRLPQEDAFKGSSLYFAQQTTQKTCRIFI